jgi:hypothetical protein
VSGYDNGTKLDAQFMTYITFTHLHPPPSFVSFKFLKAFFPSEILLLPQFRLFTYNMKPSSYQKHYRFIKVSRAMNITTDSCFSAPEEEAFLDLSTPALILAHFMCHVTSISHVHIKVSPLIFTSLYDITLN